MNYIFIVKFRKPNKLETKSKDSYCFQTTEIKNYFNKSFINFLKSLIK